MPDEPSPLAAAEKWLRYYERFWTRRLDALEALLQAEDAATTNLNRKGNLMTVDADPLLQVTRHFDASPERVFDAWLNPLTAGKWLFTTLPEK